MGYLKLRRFVLHKGLPKGVTLVRGVPFVKGVVLSLVFFHKRVSFSKEVGLFERVGSYLRDGLDQRVFPSPFLTKVGCLGLWRLLFTWGCLY